MRERLQPILDRIPRQNLETEVAVLRRDRRGSPAMSPSRAAERADAALLLLPELHAVLTRVRLQGRDVGHIQREITRAKRYVGAARRRQP